jgi:hypothetical protein
VKTQTEEANMVRGWLLEQEGLGRSREAVAVQALTEAVAVMMNIPRREPVDAQTQRRISQFLTKLGYE